MRVYARNILYSTVFGIGYGSVEQRATMGEVDGDSCRFMMRSVATDMYIKEYVESEVYAQHVLESLVPREQIEAYISTLQHGSENAVSGDSDDSSFDDDSQVEDSVARSDIRIGLDPDDYIVTHAVDNLEAIWERLSREEAHRSLKAIGDWLNLELYYATTATEARSVCSSPECIAWKALLAQLHYRARLDLINREFGGFEEFLGEIGPLFSELLLSAKRVQIAPPTAVQPQAFVPLVLLIEPSVQIGCWCLGQCWKYYKRHSTTTLEPTTTSTPPPTTLVNPLLGSSHQDRLQQIKFRHFLTESQYAIDRMLINIGSISTLTGAEAVHDICAKSFQSVMSVVTGILAYGNFIPVDAEDLIRLTTEFSAIVLSVATDLPAWKSHVVLLITQLQGHILDMEFRRS